MRQHRKERRRLVGVIGPALAGGAPQLQKVAQPRSRPENQQGGAVIGRGQDNERAEQQRSEVKDLSKVGATKHSISA